MAALDHISHSQIRMWLQCPAQWDYGYVQGIKSPPSGDLIEGSCYHKALEANFTQKIITHHDLPLDDCLDVFSSSWQVALTREEAIIWGGKTPGFVKDQGMILVAEYMATTSHLVQPVRVETPINTEIAGVRFVCIPDLVDINKIVIDHKTSSKIYIQADIDRDLQASAEAFALDRPIIFRNHVAVKTKMPHIQIIQTYRTRSDIEWWINLVTKVIAQMRTGIAPPRPTDWWCSPRFCGYYEMCRHDCAKSIFT